LNLKKSQVIYHIVQIWQSYAAFKHLFLIYCLFMIWK